MARRSTGRRGGGLLLRAAAAVLVAGAPFDEQGGQQARIGNTREFSEGRHDRLAELAPVPGAGEFLQGGFLVRAGQRAALALTAPDGVLVLVLHRTRVDDEGRVALTRLDRDHRERSPRRAADRRAAQPLGVRIGCC